MEIKVQVSKEAFELVKALAKIAKVIITQAKDGVKMDDFAPIVAALFVEIQGEGFKGLDQLPEELKKEPLKFAQAVMAVIGEEFA